MDRRQFYRAFLSPARSALAAGLVLMTGGAAAGHLSAQGLPTEPARPEAVVPTPTPPPPPAATATPWVQAPPAAPTPPRPTPAPGNDVPPVASKPTPAPKPSALTTPSAAPKPTAPPPAPKPSPVSTPATPVAPAPKPPNPRVPAGTPAAGTPEEVKAKMLRERQRELDQAMGFEPTPMTSDEQRTYEQNERIYNKLRPEEKGVINQQARARIREETVDAYIKSGLDLNEDQREVFALRFRQERRLLEREIQERANRERDRRVPQIIEQLKREFGRLNGPPAAPPRNEAPAGEKPTATPPPAASTSPVATPSSAANEGNPKAKGSSIRS